MKEIDISQLKAKCLALLEQVQKTKEPIRFHFLRGDSRDSRLGYSRAHSFFLLGQEQKGSHGDAAKLIALPMGSLWKARPTSNVWMLEGF
jgi:hypothetical protein